MDVLDVALAHEHDWLCRQATEVHPVDLGGARVGEVVLTTTVPRIRDHNTVVLAPCPTIDGDTVLDLLDRELGGRGVPHRRLHCTAADADRWAAALADHGYERSDTVVMTWGGTAPRPGDVPVEVADRPTTAAVVRNVLGDDHVEGSPVLEELVALALAQHDLGVQVLVARVDGVPAGALRLFPGDGVAQLEELQVAASARGRGVGRALLAAGLAHAAEQALVFLTSDPDDWPTTWYSRLGFRIEGRSSGFVREAVEGPA